MATIELRKYAYIDALRGLAVLGVVAVHSSQWIAPASGALALLAQEGQKGVQLFFLASALTLFLSMSERARHERSPILGFFIRRFFRIAPLFYCAIVVYTAQQGMAGRYWAPDGISWWQVALTAFFLHGWHPETITSVVPGGWSIAVEMTFYLCVPLLFSRLNGIRPTLVLLFLSLLAAWLTSQLAVQLLSPLYPPHHQYLVQAFSFFWFFAQFPVFLCGILLHQLLRKFPHCDPGTARLMLAASLFLLVALMRSTTVGALLPSHILWGFAFILLAFSLHHAPVPILVNKFTVLVGKLSFSIYLVHFMVLKILQRAFREGFPVTGDLGFLAAFTGVLGLSIGVAMVSFRLVETPGINLGKRVVRKLCPS